MKTLILTAMVTATLLSTSVVYAGNTNSQMFDKREQNQAQRIKDGVQSGALTGKEAVRLIGNQARIRQQEKRYKADGQLTAKERLKLHRELNQSSRQIRKQKHDAQTR